MVDLAFDGNEALDKRRQAADNLVVLSRDKSGAEALAKEGILQKIQALMKVIIR